jgi:hypothetical protein
MKKIIGLLFLSFNAYAVDPSLHWQTLETEHFNIHFAKGQESLAYRVATTAESAHKQVAPIIYWQPLQKTELVISDETDQPNGYAIPFPFSRSVLFMSPPDEANTLEDFDDWLKLLITHEYTHVLHLDKVRGAPESLREVFGRHFLLFPNMFQPGWLTEGLATHLETEQNTGRGQSTLFNMMMRTEVANGVKPVAQVNLPMRDWPMGTAHYLYGVYFYQYMTERYGDAGVHMLLENYSNNLLPFAINTNMYQLFGKDVTQVWAEYSAWLENKYQEQIHTLQAQNPVQGEKISQSGYFTGEVDVLPDGRVFYVRQGAFDHAMLMMMDAQGQSHELTEVHAGARIDVDARYGVLIAQPEICREYNVYADVYRFDLTAMTMQRLTKCGRYRSAAWTPDGQIIAVQMSQGQSALQQLSAGGEKLAVLWQGDENSILGTPDVSPDGQYLAASVFRKGAGWNIELFDLNSHQWRAITADDAIDMYPRFSADATLLFSSDRNGEYNVYRYELNGQHFKQLTRTSSGAFRAAQAATDAPLYYVSYNARGYDVYKLEQATTLGMEPVIEVSNNQRVAETIQTARVQDVREYSPWPTLKPVWWSPWLTLSQDQNEFGFETAGNDALGLHNYALALAYDTSNQWLVGHFNYAWSNRVLAGVMRETSVYHDMFGDFIAASQDDDMYLVLNSPFTQIESRWNVLMGVLSSRNHIEHLASGWIFTGDDAIDRRAIVQMRFDNTQRYIRSVSVSDGRNLKLEAETSDVWASDYTGEVYTLDWREYLSLGNQHVLAVRALGGYGTDNPEPFRLGGENNSGTVLDNLLTMGEPLLGERDYALRGYAEGLPQLQGRRMRLMSAEWRFPLANVERGWMAPPVGIMQWHGSVFAENGAAWNDTPDKSYSSAGVELHGDINLFYGINVEMRLGVAQGLDKDLGEARAYFTLGSAF